MKKLDKNSPGFAFLLFHLSVGTCLAIRTLIPLVAVIFAIYYLFGPAFFYAVAASFIHMGFLLTGLLSAVISLSVAGIAARRVCLGLDGWIRHLPASNHTHRRLAGFAIFVAQLPILAILAIIAPIACAKFGVSATTYLAGLPFLGLASAQCVLPVKRKIIARPLTALACISVASGDWQFLIGGVILIMIADVISGSFSPAKRPSNFHSAFKGSLLIATIGWRALRLRLFMPWVLSLPILGATTLFLSNNNLNPLLSKKAIYFGGALSMIVFCATFANMLASRRPPWPWARSLPWSAKQRIVIDSIFLSLHTIPLLVFVAMINIKTVIPLAASLPLLAVYSSSAMRGAPECRMGASGKILLNGALGALSLCLFPLISLVFLALTLLLLKVAVKDEQSQKVSRWLELHHLAAGDSLSWSK